MSCHGLGVKNGGGCRCNVRKFRWGKPALKEDLRRLRGAQRIGIINIKATCIINNGYGYMSNEGIEVQGVRGMI